jgi:hypothetical protein
MRNVKKGPRRDIQVWGVILEDGRKIDAGTDGIVSVYALKGDGYRTVDENNNHTEYEDSVISYNPRFN